MSNSTQSIPLEITLDVDEQVEHIAHCHWILLLYKWLVPGVLILLSTAFVIYRWVGGHFFVLGSAARGLIDPFNIILIATIVISAVAALINYRAKKRSSSWIAVAVLLVSAAILAFRYQGGRILVINPFEPAGLDTLNLIAILFIISLFLICVYIWVDWRNDTLILTNKRLIHDKNDLFHRHTQDQIAIDKIESASAVAKTYMTYWLDYGMVIVQARTAGRRISVNMVAKPKELTGKISAKVGAINKTRTQKHYDDMIDKHVYNDKVRTPPPHLELRVRHAPKWLNWLFFDNPEIDDEKGEVIWYTHWLFVFASVFWPALIFVVGMVVLFISIQTTFQMGIWALLAGVMLFTICGVWGTWRYKDTTDDYLQLTSDNLIKVDKLPFGPEARRSASLGAIRNISHRSSFIGRVLGYGTVEVQTAGSDTPLLIHAVPDPREIIGTIQEYMAEYRARERERNLSDTLALMHHFHAAQLGHDELFDDNDAAAPQAVS